MRSMRRTWPALLLIGWSAATAAPRLEIDPWAFGTLIGRAQRDRPDEVVRVQPDGTFDTAGFLTPRLDDDDLLLYAAVGVELRWGAHLEGALSAATGALVWREGEVLADGRPFADEAEETGFLRDAWLHGTLGDAAVEAGRRRLRVGGGLLIDEIATGAAARYDADPVGAEIGAWWVGRSLEPEGQPLALVRARWLPDFLSEVYVFGAATRYTDDLARALAQPAIDRILVGLGPVAGAVADLALAECARIDADFTLGWVGAGAELILDGGSLRAHGAVGLGEGALRGTPRADAPLACRALVGREVLERRVDRDLSVRSAGVTVEARLHRWSTLYPGVFAIWLTGQGGDFDDQLGAFLAPAPFLARPRLFFGAGLGSSLQGRAPAAAGVSGRGVRLFGASLLWAPTQTIEINLDAATLWADTDDALADGRHYGEEVDLWGRWRVTDAVALRAEVDALWLGAFYPEDGVWWQAVAGVEAEWAP